MSAIRFGCQTYTWQMSYARYCGQIPHILSVVAKAGFTGLEPEVCMLGGYERGPALLAATLCEHGITLAALTLVCDWRGAAESDEERRLADSTLDYLRDFPGTLLGLCQMPGADRNDLSERQRHAVACANAVGRRAAERGVMVAFHPNSPSGSVFRDTADYAFLLEHLDPQVVGFMPDMGHIAKGGMDPLDICRAYRDCIAHIHFKDIDAQGHWTAMGRGVIDWPAIVRYLADSRYEGWIMVEEESAEAERHPDEVTLANGSYVRDVLMPCLGGQRQEPSA